MHKNNYKSRIEFWNDDNHFEVVIKGELERNEFVRRLKAKNEGEFYISDLIRSCKELIFDKVDGKNVFSVILPEYDPDTLTIRYSDAFNIIIHDGTESSGNFDEVDEILEVLGFAIAFEIPVFPNKKEYLEELTGYLRMLVLNGFKIKDGDGHVVVKPKSSLTVSELTVENLDKLNTLKHWSSVEVSLLKKEVLKELNKLNSTKRIITSLEYAILELGELLRNKSRNENELQRFLTENPILFGLEYVQIIPKHRLGSEYEMDYALVNHNGMVDLVEIESSNLPIYTKRGNPSSKLTHAEQQVLDWLDWIERNNSYSQRNLQGMLSPKGFVVIGKSDSLSIANKEKLNRRNIIYRDRLLILTYDDLLDRARNILSRLQNLKVNTV